MKKLVLWTMVCLSMLLFVMAEEENLYLYDALNVNINVNGQFELVADGPNAKLKTASAALLLYPHNDFRQMLLDIKNTGTVEGNKVTYTWDDQTLGKKTFGYKAQIKTANQRLKVTKNIFFPLTNEDIKGFEEYTLPSDKIDSNNPKIVARARELSEGEEDLFKVVFKLASWVEENVVYDLNTLTATASQKASWVLENRQGVCDEMTSLFVAMARSLGIPARFVSGVSYTTSALFEENWQPHGWAEVYFPSIGWVSFDITFGEYGYVDVTHIKLRDGFDPSEPATKYEWFAEMVKLESKPLEFKINVLNKGNIVPDEIELEQEILATEISPGSYNLVRGIVKNKGNYYTAAALKLAVPPEVELVGRNRRNIILSPKEIRETYWIVRVSDKLQKGYLYEFPAIVYSEKNVTVLDSFKAQEGKEVYSFDDIEALTITDEEKSYSRKVKFDCEYIHELLLGQDNKIKCSINNNGDTDLKKLHYCVGNVCEVINLNVNKGYTSSITLKSDKVGWQKVVVTAENDLVEKKSSLEYVVLDPPSLEIKSIYPSSVSYGQPFPLKVHLTRKSFSVPEDINIVIQGKRFEYQWKLASLQKEEMVELQLEDFPLARSNEFIIFTHWKDKNGQLYSEKNIVVVKGEAKEFGEKLKLWVNSFLNLF